MNVRAATTSRRAHSLYSPKTHESAGTKQREQFSPTGDRVCEMMQDADRGDQVECPADRCEPQDIGLRVFDVRYARLDGFALHVGEARQAQIDGEHARPGKLLRGFERLLTGTAPGNQDFDLGAVCRGLEIC